MQRPRPRPRLRPRSLADRLAVEPLEGRRVMAGTPTVDASLGAPPDDLDAPVSIASTVGTTSVEDRVDLAVTIDDGRSAYVPGGTLIYTIVASNAGPATATDTAVRVPLPSGASGASWTATFTGGAAGANTGFGGIDTAVTLPSGATATYRLSVTVAAATRGPVVATASVICPSFVDVSPTNDVATDTDRLPLVVAGAEIGVDRKPRVRVLDATTATTFASFLAYEPTFRGGVRVALGDVDGDGVDEVVTGPGSGRVAEIRVFRLDGTELTAYRTRPFGDAYLGGIDVAAGDVNGDGRADLAAAMTRDGGDVRVFRTVAAADPVVDAPWLAVAHPFGEGYAGGASVALADVGTFASGALVNGVVPDGKMELVVGSGPGTATRVLVYDVSEEATPQVVDRIRPFASDFEGGVSVSAARVNTDGIDDIVIAAGRGGGGKVEIYDGSVGGTDTRLQAFTAFADSSRPNGAVFAAAVDGNGDGLVDGYVAAQGGPAGTTGSAQATLTKLAGGWRVAASRTFFGLQSVAAATRIATTTVPLGTIRTLESRDFVVGTGAPAKAGDELRVQYIGMLTDGFVFDTSRRPGRNPFEFTLGASEVIAGWDAGLVGMRVGGRRLLVIPPELAYGDDGQGDIPANATLVFDVELLSVT